MEQGVRPEAAPSPTSPVGGSAPGQAHHPTFMPGAAGKEGNGDGRGASTDSAVSPDVAVSRGSQSSADLLRIIDRQNKVIEALRAQVAELRKTSGASPERK